MLASRGLVPRRLVARRLVRCVLVSRAVVSFALVSTAFMATLAPGVARAQQSRPEAKPTDAYRDQIVAEVEHEPITYHELELAARLTAEYRDLKGNQPDNKRALQQSLVKILETLIEERLLLQQCTKEKLTLTKEDEKRLDREIERQAEAYNGVEGLKVRLKDIGVPYDYFVERKKTNILITKLIFKNVSHEIYVEPERIRRYYEENKHEKFKRDAVTKFFQIDIYRDLASNRIPTDLVKHASEVAAKKDVVNQLAPPSPTSEFDPVEGVRVPRAAPSPPPKPSVLEVLENEGWNSATARHYAEQVRVRLLSDKTAWRQIATDTTMNAAAVSDGGLVQVAGDKPLADQMGPLGAAADRLQPGEVSPVIDDARSGFHIICMKQRSPADVLPFSEVQREIADRLRNEIWQERLKAWIGKIKADAFYRIYLPSE